MPRRIVLSADLASTLQPWEQAAQVRASFAVQASTRQAQATMMSRLVLIAALGSTPQQWELLGQARASNAGPESMRRRQSTMMSQTVCCV